jgi:hypothetical protein
MKIFLLISSNCVGFQTIYTLTLNSWGFSDSSTNLKISAIALTISPSAGLLVFGGVSELLDDVEDEVEGVAAFFGFGPNIVCVLPGIPYLI